MTKENWADYIPYNERSDVKRKNRIILGLTGLLILTLVVIGSSVNSKPNASQTSAAKAGTQNSEPTEVSAINCFAVETAVTMVRMAFSEGKNSPTEMGYILDAVASDWAAEAIKTSGSEADWLNKMAELSLEVKSFILTGLPIEGPTRFDQLNANMNLVDQFCQ